ncbi:MAG TPA: RNA 2',3'-cyclic phosphodiesterase [bacterium]|nr:RNA 2',3'-cyclic phosphodiesterase [bacterium]HPN42921.1 RNA 2',3'-cyclic phosphodiesterase [bacterium]
MADIRTFICFDIPASIREQLAVLQNHLKSCGRGVSWTNPAGIHLTLKFLGDVPEVKIKDINIAVKNTVQGLAPLAIKIAGTGAFPNLRRPRVYWVGVHEATGQLAECQKQIDLALEKHGFAREARAFSPHLTLGRVKSLEAVEAISRELAHKEYEFGEYNANEIIIMKSDLRPTGAVYTPLFRIKL